MINYLIIGYLLAILTIYLIGKVRPTSVCTLQHYEEDPNPEFIFSCPSCGSCNANVSEPLIDIHVGATYTCNSCLEDVIFIAYSADEYIALAARADSIKEINHE